MENKAIFLVNSKVSIQENLLLLHLWYFQKVIHEQKNIKLNIESMFKK